MNAKELLDKLGDTPDAVASTLRQCGVRGKKEDDELCPVANYLRARGVKNPHVGRYWLNLFTQGEVKLPQSVEDFIDNFDNGEYSDLEMP